MSKYATLAELKAVAKEYCKQQGYDFIFANEDKFGFEDKQGSLWTLNYFELADILMKKEKKNEVDYE